MKKTSWLVLVSGLVVFASCGGNDTKTENENTQTVEVKSVGGDLTIGYYDMDKIATDFDFYVNTQKELESKKKSIDNKLAAQQKAYESAAIALQKGVNANTLSQNQIEAYQIKMRNAEEETFKIQQTEGMAFENESMKANEVLVNKIDNYAKEFAEKNGIKLFLSKAVGGQVSYVDTTFNMTDAFISFMNSKEEEITKDTQSK